MEYRTGKYIRIEAGKFYKTTNKLETDTGKLDVGTIIKVTQTLTNYIEFKVFVPVGNKIDYAVLNDSISNNSPAEIVPFEYFIESLYELDAPELLELNVPMDFWEQEHLLYYIAFLEDQIADKDKELEDSYKPDTDKVKEVIDWLTDLRDGTDDALGKNCMKAIRLLRFIINDGGN